MIDKLAEWFDMSPEAVKCGLWVAAMFGASYAIAFGLVFIANSLGIN